MVEGGYLIDTSIFLEVLLEQYERLRFKIKAYNICIEETCMNQKAHTTGGIILAGALMITGEPPFAASFAAFGSLFNDLDLRWFHRKLLHNIYVTGIFLALSLKYPPFAYWALGMFLHNVMDLMSSSPVYLLWPVSREGEHLEIGGWGVANMSILSFPVGVGTALLFSLGYMAATGHLEDVIVLFRNILELFS